MGKKVLSTENGGNGVLIRCSDGYEADGDILVGADGAYSAVRQSLYEKLKKVNRLSPSDALPLPYSTVCLVAQTVPISSEEFPDLALDESQFRQYINTKTMYSVRRAMKAPCYCCAPPWLSSYVSNHSFRCYFTTSSGSHLQLPRIPSVGGQFSILTKKQARRTMPSGFPSGVQRQR